MRIADIMKNVEQSQAQKLTGGLWINTAPTVMAQGTLTHTRTMGQYREYVGQHVTHTVTTENQKKKEKENKTHFPQADKILAVQA